MPAPSTATTAATISRIVLRPMSDLISLVGSRRMRRTCGARRSWTTCSPENSVRNLVAQKIGHIGPQSPPRTPGTSTGMQRAHSRSARALSRRGPRSRGGTRAPRRCGAASGSAVSVAGLLGPVRSQDLEPADRLGLGHRGVGLVDGPLDLGPQVGVGGVGAQRPLAVTLGPRVVGLGVQGDQRGDVRTAVADDQALADQRARRGSAPRGGRGTTFLPPAVTMISLARPVTRTKPSASISARSPVAQPAARRP